MKVFALVCKGPRASFGQVGQIWHRRVFEDVAAAQSASVDFRKACVTDTGTAHDLENLEDSSETRVHLKELELVSPTLEKMRAALARLREEGDGCFGGRCYVGYADGHSPECVLANAAIGFEKDGSIWKG